MILSKKPTTKALIRLRRCAGWSAHVLFATPEDRFSRNDAHLIYNLLYFITLYIVVFFISQIAAGSQTVLGIMGKIDVVDSITGKLKLL